MIDGFNCDDCSSMFSIDNLGVIGSPVESCSPFVEIITLCDKCVYERLDSLLKTMEVPVDKMRDFDWLQSNIFVIETDNPKYAEAEFLVEAIIKNKPICQKDK
jgi:hypothetical protein